MHSNPLTQCCACSSPVAPFFLYLCVPCSLSSCPHNNTSHRTSATGHCNQPMDLTGNVCPAEPPGPRGGLCQLWSAHQHHKGSGHNAGELTHVMFPYVPCFGAFPRYTVAGKISVFVCSLSTDFTIVSITHCATCVWTRPKKQRQVCHSMSPQTPSNSSSHLVSQAITKSTQCSSTCLS
jgi:hypothetical protein